MLSQCLSATCRSKSPAPLDWGSVPLHPPNPSVRINSPLPLKQRSVFHGVPPRCFQHQRDPPGLVWPPPPLTMMPELLANNLAHNLGCERLRANPEVNTQCLVDQCLIPFARSFREILEALDHDKSSKYIVMRFFPTCGNTAPRLALEKSYSFFTGAHFLGLRFTHGDYAHPSAPIGVNNNPQCPRTGSSRW